MSCFGQRFLLPGHKGTDPQTNAGTDHCVISTHLTESTVVHVLSAFVSFDFFFQFQLRFDTCIPIMVVCSKLLVFAVT